MWIPGMKKNFYTMFRNSILNCRLVRKPHSKLELSQFAVKEYATLFSFYWSITLIRSSLCNWHVCHKLHRELSRSQASFQTPTSSRAKHCRSSKCAARSWIASLSADTTAAKNRKFSNHTVRSSLGKVPHRRLIKNSLRWVFSSLYI